VQLYRYFVSQSSEFCRHNPLCCFTTSSTKGKRIFLYRVSPGTFGYTVVHSQIRLQSKHFMFHIYIQLYLFFTRREFWIYKVTQVDIIQLSIVRKNKMSFNSQCVYRSRGRVSRGIKSTEPELSPVKVSLSPTSSK
jgi:hypothetical protein